jgi:hypothetical protein
MGSTADGFGNGFEWEDLAVGQEINGVVLQKTCGSASGVLVTEPMVRTVAARIGWCG